MFNDVEIERDLLSHEAEALVQQIYLFPEFLQILRNKYPNKNDRNHTRTILTDN